MTADLSLLRALDTEVVADVQAQVARELARTLPPDHLLAPSEDDEAQAWAVIARTIAETNRQRVLADRPPLDAAAQDAVGQAVFDALLRLGPLQHHLSDPEVEEVMLNGFDRAFVVYAGGRKQQVPSGFTSEAELHAFVARTVAATGRRLDEASPAVDARLPDGNRLHAIAPPLAPFTCLTIRRHRLAAQSLADLIQLRTLTPPVAELLAAAMRAGLNLLISGGTATGKTSTLNALGSEIPRHERVVTIEETQELQLGRYLPDCIPLEARFANAEGAGRVGMRDLVRHALRMRPSRIIVGEVRGPEALDMLSAMNSGHEGSAGTIHANSGRQALSKLRTYTTMAEEGLPAAVVTEMLAETVDLVVQLRLLGDGRRVVAEVAELDGVEGGRILTNELVRLDADQQPTLTGLRPRTAERLLQAGWRPAAAPYQGWGP